MKQIAQRAGVSLGTVSHVLNGTAHVREPLRERVLEAVRVSGYQPSQLARGLRRDKTNILAMVIPDIANPFFPGVVRGAEDVAFRNGYRLVLSNTDNDHAKELAQLTALRTYLPSGLIVIPSSFSEVTELAESYRQSGAAVVCVDRLPRDWQGDTVTIDNVEGACHATRQLLALGHRRLAAITGPLHLTNASERIQGFRQALHEAGIEPRADYLLESTFDREGGYKKAMELLAREDAPTAIFACNDLLALGVLMAARERGLRVPEDLSIVGFDGMDLTEITTPQLASVAQSPYEIGAAAAQLVLDRLATPESPAQHIIVPTTFKAGGSIARPCVVPNL